MYWSWILTAIGITGFLLAANKVWWCWYINIACQVLWFAYGLTTEQFGFVWASLFYTAVFGYNAYKWTKEHREKIRRLDEMIKNDIDHTYLRYDDSHAIDVGPWKGLIEVDEKPPWLEEKKDD